MMHIYIAFSSRLSLQLGINSFLVFLLVYVKESAKSESYLYDQNLFSSCREKNAKITLIHDECNIVQKYAIQRNDVQKSMIGHADILK